LEDSFRNPDKTYLGNLGVGVRIILKMTAKKT
jgi:hypothetical protein